MMPENDDARTENALSPVISAHQLLRGAMRRVGRQCRVRNVWFRRGVSALIADDSDYHRIRRGYMRYRSAKIIRLGSRGTHDYWLVARGVADGAYPADHFDSDLLVRRVEPPFEYGQRLADRMAALIQESNFFRYSLIVAQADGNLFSPTFNTAGARLGILLEAKADRWLARPARVNNDLLLASTLQPVVEEPFGFRRTAAAELAELIRQALATC